MSSKLEKDQGHMSYQALLDKNRSLETEVQDLKVRLEEAEELRRAISEGDLDALIIRKPEEELVFTLDSADRAYRVLVETMNEGTATLSSDGTILYCNRQFAELTKMPPRTVVGTSIYGFIAPEDAITFKALLKQQTSVGEIKLQAWDSTSVPVYLSISSLQSEGSPNAWCLVVTDLTEQKKNEEIVAAERLARSIIEQAAEAIVVCDTTGRITHFSNAVPKVCKCDPAFKTFEDIIDVRFSEGGDAGKSILPVSSALKGDTFLGIEAILELEECQKSHKKIHLLLNSGPLKNSDGKIVGCVVTLTDITDRKRTEETLQQAMETLRFSENQFRVLVQNVKSGIALIDETGRFAVVNPSFMQMFGLNSELDILNVNNQDWSQWEVYGEDGKLLHIDDHPVRKAVLTSKPVKDQLVAVRNPRAKELTWMLISAEPILEEDDNIHKVICTYHDITERKRIEKELHESEKRFKLLSEANSILLLSKEPENMIQIIAGKVMQHLNCDVFFNYVFDETRGRLHLNAYGGISKEAAKEIEWLDKGAAICGCVALDGYRIVSEDVQHNGDNRANLVRSMGIQAYYCQPLRIGETTIGTLSFGTSSKKNFNEDELTLMSTVADQVSVAIERKRTEETLRELYERIKIQSEELRISNEELKAQSEELKEANEALNKSEKRFRTLAENSPDIIARFDRQKRHIYANPAVVEPYGRLPEEIIGKTQSELGRYSGQLKFWEKHYENVFATGKPETVEFQYVSSQGKKHYLNTKIVPEIVDGNVASVLAISRDITNIKETEIKLKETLDNLENLVKERTTELEKAYESLKESERGLAEAQEMAHLGNWYRSLITDKIYWSDETYRIFGFKPREFEVTFDTFLNYVHPEDRDFVENNFKKALKGEPYSNDYRIITANGIERIIYSQGEVVFDEKNVPVQMRGTIQDITERKMAEKALEKMDKIRIKEIHHRIKNNLQVICSLLSLEAERFSDEKMLEALKESQNRVASMALIHEELYRGNKSDNLDFAVYLHKFTKDLFSSYNLGNNNVSLKTDFEQVYLDMDAAVPLGIIVNELISNSLKHAFPAERKGEIHISLRRTDAYDIREDISGPDQDCREKGNFQYILRVMDNGRGIPEEVEIENADSLGLQLVNTLVDQIDGCIELKRNCGTNFAIWFGNKEP